MKLTRSSALLFTFGLATACSADNSDLPTSGGPLPSEEELEAIEQAERDDAEEDEIEAAIELVEELEPEERPGIILASDPPVTPTGEEPPVTEEPPMPPGTGPVTEEPMPPVVVDDPPPLVVENLEDFEAMTLDAAPTNFDSSKFSFVVAGPADSGNALQLLDDQDDMSATARTVFEAPASRGVIQARMYFPSGTGLTRFLTVYHGGSNSSTNRVIDMLVGSNAALKVRNVADSTSGDMDTGMVLTEDTWLDIEVSWDSTEYTFTVDDEAVGPFPILSTEPVTNMEFKAGSNAALFLEAALFVDDFGFAVE